MWKYSNCLLYFFPFFQTLEVDSRQFNISHQGAGSLSKKKVNLSRNVIIWSFVCSRLQKNVKAASETEYPAYGVTGPVPEKVASPGDRKLAQSAQMYHYQHQKQQMIAMEKLVCL